MNKVKRWFNRVTVKSVSVKQDFLNVVLGFFPKTPFRVDCFC